MRDISFRTRERSNEDTVPSFLDYPKNLAAPRLPKLGVPRLCERLRFALDLEGGIYLDNVDVNGVLFDETHPTVGDAGRFDSRLLNSNICAGHLVVPMTSGRPISIHCRVADSGLPRALKQNPSRILGNVSAGLSGAVGMRRADFISWLASTVGARQHSPARVATFWSGLIY